MGVMDSDDFKRRAQAAASAGEMRDQAEQARAQEVAAQLADFARRDREDRERREEERKYIVQLGSEIVRAAVGIVPFDHQFTGSAQLPGVLARFSKKAEPTGGCWVIARYDDEGKYDGYEGGNVGVVHDQLMLDNNATFFIHNFGTVSLLGPRLQDSPAPWGHFGSASIIQGLEEFAGKHGLA
jgi:hypothetical protein